MEQESGKHKQQPASTMALGRELFGAREQRGMSIEDVARALNLSPRHISALESDDYESLSGPTYIRGYLRGYAQLLDLDADALIRRYNEAHRVSQETPELGSLTPPVQASSNDGLVKLGTVVVAGLVLGLAVIWWMGREETPPPPVPQAAVPSAPEQMVAQEPNDVALLGDGAAADSIAMEPGGTEAPAADATLSRSAPPSAVPSAGVTTPASEKPLTTPAAPLRPATGVPPGVAAQAPASAAKPVVPTAPATDSAAISPTAPRVKLIVHTAEESWIDIRDARQSKLLYETLPAGRTVTVEGVAPLNVFLGNAEAVTVDYNGSPYDITPFRRGQIARFTLPPPRRGNTGLLGP